MSAVTYDPTRNARTARALKLPENYFDIDTVCRHVHEIGPEYRHSPNQAPAIEAQITRAVMAGDIAWARRDALDLALLRDWQLTSAEFYAVARARF